MPRQLMLVIFLLFYGGSAHAEFYKWTDENGGICYGEFPPTQTSPEQIGVYPGPSSNEVRRYRQQMDRIIELQKQLWEERQKLIESSEMIRQQQARERVELDKKCKTSRSWLRLLNRTGREDLWYIDEEDGGYYFATPERRKELRSRYENIIHEHCQD